MERINYKLVTQSSLIVSPRASKGFYQVFEEFSPDQITQDTEYLDKNRLKVIYPFYQYGEYKGYSPESAEYYLPGSSIKGALYREGLAGFMVDDVPVHNGCIVLRNLYKAQYVKEELKACFEVFFENVGVEMLKYNVELIGELYAKDRGSAEAVLKTANESTRVRLNQMMAYLHKLKGGKYKDELLGDINKAFEKLSLLRDSNDIFILGGYKGLLHSMKLDVSQQTFFGAVFLDRETMLPHGLVKIKLG